MVVVIAAGMLNLVLDPYLMFNLGWGMAGAAWATTISQVFGAVAFLIIIARRKKQFGIDEALDGALKRARRATEDSTPASFVTK